MIRLERIKTLRESIRQPSRDPEILALGVGEGRRIVCLLLVPIRQFHVVERGRQKR